VYYTYIVYSPSLDAFYVGHTDDRAARLVEHRTHTSRFTSRAKDWIYARIYLQDVNRDVGEINEVWAQYLGDHPVNRRCYGVDLQARMLVEAGFVAEVPE
jgi:enamine deaminase RidA (YjgF/YER057c/UK114 family)